MSDVAQGIKNTPPPVESISFRPAPHAAKSFEAGAGLKVAPGQDPRLALLAWEHRNLCSELLHTSLPKASDALQDVLPRRNGFIDTVIEAYSQHRALIIRPDDVWLAILTQFCFFVNGNAEALRSAFVAHEGKRELVLTVPAKSHYTMDAAWMAQQMTDLMQKHIVDSSLREWVVPNFTTTTRLNRSISAMVMMGTMKEYFSYCCVLLCGIPKVTIEGEKSDWENILHRLERLKKYGIQTIAWYHLLRPVISRIAAAYDNPDSRDNLKFWSKVAFKTPYGSGTTWLSGWITAFCVFDEKGRWQGNKLVEDENKGATGANGPSRLSPEEFASVYTCKDSKYEDTPHLALDGFPYPKVDTANVPCGYTCVDVKLDDNGALFDTMFLAGLAGSQICSEKTAQNGTLNTVRPFSAWWYFIKGEKSKDGI